jgi:predicted alpha/beta superfamily hydrolase
MNIIFKYCTLIIIAFYPQLEFAQDCVLEIIIETSGLSPTDTVFIAGNRGELGYWNPGKIAMLKEDDQHWKFSLRISSGSPVEYKFTLGSWESEACDSNQKHYSNFRVTALSDTVLHYILPYWNCSEPAMNKVKGKITGEIRYHRNRQAMGLKPRDVIVWLPPGYDSTLNKRYPVLYLQDGQNLFDPSTSFAGVDWQVDEIADSLIRQGKIEPFIIVGICNTVDRSKEYVPSALSQLYTNFILDSVKPFIDKTYKTISEKESTMAGGSSAGGTIAFILAWEYPEIFSGAICLSPAFLIDSINCIELVENYTGPKKPLTFYFDIGGIGLEKELQPGIEQMIVALTKQGFQINSDLFFVLDPNADHSEVSWAARMPAIVKLFYLTAKD